MKKLFSILIAGACLALCLVTAAAAAVPDPYPPVPGAHPTATAAPAAAPSREPSGEASSDEPSEEPAAAEPAPLPLVAGTYKGSDGSVLKVKADGTCTYAADVSGTVNGKAMSGRLTFHGTLAAEGFTFTKVTYFGLDLTEIARSSGLDDASYWEQAAAVIYADALDL